MALDPAEIHYGIRGQKYGPVELESFADRLRAGQLSADDFVWDDDLDDWVQIHRYPALLAAIAAGLPGQIEVGDPILQSVAVEQDQAGDRPAGFLLRLLAFLLDDLVLIVPMAIWSKIYLDLTGHDPITLQMLLDASPTELDSLLDQLTQITGGAFLLRGIYHALMESSSLQATVGKLLLGLRVTDERGARISLGRAVVRHFGRLLCQITLFFGYVMIMFTAKGQGLHDKVAGTLVVRRRR